MFYILYGNSAETLRKELSAKRQENATKDIEFVKDLALDIFYEELINGSDFVTFVEVVNDSANEIVFSVKGNHSDPEIQKNKNYFNA